MYTETNYYQISGFRAHSNGWFKMYDDKPMTEAIIATTSKLFRPGGQDAPVELVLGILPSGASYLLMSNEQMLEFTHKHRLRIPRGSWRTTDFLSLSPIYFTSLKELTAKIATYKQRPRNKNRRESEVLQDNSSANRGYFQPGSGGDDKRGYFEHQRTLYRLLTRDLEPGKVGLVPPSWLGCVRVLSLAFVEWSADKRVRGVRLEDPLLVEVGWTEARFPSFFEQLTGATVHFKLKSHMKNPDPINPYVSEVVEGDQAALYSRLRDLFSHDTNKSGIPLIVLVHDEQMARVILERAGIDITAWFSGLADLLPLAPIRAEEGTPNLPGPCIVDTQQLVKTLMMIKAKPGNTVPESARMLRMQTDTKPCAGDDSLLQMRMWVSMAQGPAIDEQYTQRDTHRPDRARVLAPPTLQKTDTVVDPDDVDPNDFDLHDGPVRSTIPDDFSSDDDDW